MKDLYRRLGLLPEASSEQILAEIAKLSPRNHIRRAAEQILLHPQRREQYHSAVSTLRVIGQLRANLGLSQAPLWLESPLRDFDTAPSLSRTSQLDGLRDNRGGEAPAAPPITKRPIPPVVLVLMAMALGWVIWGFVRPSQPSPLAFDPSSAVPSAPGNVPSAPSQESAPTAQPFPATGILINDARGLREGAPFTVVTARNGAYYIKLIDVATGSVVLSAFIRGGDRISTLLPAGNYELRYASGASWYGFDDLFGVDTAYAKADEVFRLTRTPYGYEGVTVELILQRSGNLRTEGISANAF